jgi:hypothetical protein
MPSDSLTVVDNRTGKSYEIPIENGTIRTTDLKKIKTGAEDFGLMAYDPGFMNTAACKSRITFIDGDKGILRYRGYPIEQLAEQSSFLEVAYLLYFGELPTRPARRVREHRDVAHADPRADQEVHRRVPARRPPDGHVPLHRGRAFHVLQRGQEHLRRPEPAGAVRAHDGQDADHRGLLPPPLDRHAVRLPRWRAQLCGQFPEHDVQGYAAALQAQPGRWSARSTCCSSCTPTTSRIAPPPPCAASAARTAIRSPRWPARPPRSTARCTAAPTRPFCAC